MMVFIKSQALNHLGGRFQISLRMHTVTTVGVTMTEKICHLIWGIVVVIVALINKHIQDFLLLFQQVINSAMENILT